jgi:ribonuclease HI
VRQKAHGPSIYDRLVSPQNSNYFVHNGIRKTLPTEAHPAELIETSEGKFQPRWKFSSIVNKARQDEKRTDEDEEKAECENVDILERAEELIACSDGSYNPISQKAAFNWRIITREENGLTSVSAPVMTNQKYLNPYRAEFAGLRSLIRYLKKKKLHRKRIRIHCDSKSCVDLLQKGRHTDDLASLEKAESDIITSIQKLLEDFDDTIIIWVKSHQDDDDDIAYEDRPLEVRLNIDCDLAAKACLERCERPTKRPPPLEGVEATLYFGVNMVTKDVNGQIQYARQAPQMMEYICERTGWTTSQMACVNTRSLGIAKKRLDLSRSIRTTKMLYDWLNLGIQKGYMKKDHRCPGCGDDNEDFLHLYHCTHQDMQSAFAKAMTTAKSKLVREGVSSEIYNAYVAAMCEAAHQPHPDIRYDGSPEEVTAVLELQEQLGQTAILKGFHHVQWVHLLQAKWKPMPKKKSDSKAPRQKDALEQSISLIKASWDVFEALWEARNEILHNGENMLTEAEMNSTELRLLQFRRNCNTLLRECDRAFIDKPEIQIMNWSPEKKRRRLFNLEKLHRIYLTELKRESERQRPITYYFQPALPQLS